MSEMSDIVDRMFNITSPASQKQSGGLTMDEVDGNFEGFKPPFVEQVQTNEMVIRKEMPIKKKMSKGMKFLVKAFLYKLGLLVRFVSPGKRQSGRAGGGWEDEDETDSVESGSTYSSPNPIQSTETSALVIAESWYYHLSFLNFYWLIEVFYIFFSLFLSLETSLENMSSEISFFNEFVSGDPDSFFTVSELQKASKRLIKVYINIWL